MNTHARHYQRSFEELEEVASKFWPSELSELEANISIIPLLLRTQDQFISILSIETLTLDRLFEIVEASAMSANLFVKHLVILADFGGEMLQRVSSEHARLFPQSGLRHYWQGTEQLYMFKTFPRKRFSNQTLKIDGKGLLESYPLDSLQKDVIALLLFGSAYSDDDDEVSTILARCQIGNYLGKPDDLATFIKQRYIWVSRITGGAKANSLGQIAQRFVSEYLQGNLGISDMSIRTGGRLPGVTHTDPETGRLTSFDLVITDGRKYVAVEVSFQVTTNSTIERKAGQARDRFKQIEDNGHKIAYVIDGAGNFQREQAITTICAHSNCTVAFSRAELDVLCDFLREQFASS